MKLSFRKICLFAHRELGFFFAGVICIYAISGIFMNHRNEIDPRATVEVTRHDLPAGLTAANINGDAIAEIATACGIEPSAVSKHYMSEGRLRILVKGGSSITADFASRSLTCENVKPRLLIADMVKLHYNPGSWWTWFSDIMAAALLILVISGIAIVKGRKGLLGRGGLLLIAGILIPILFLL